MQADDTTTDAEIEDQESDLLCENLVFSCSWGNGLLGAVYFNIDTLELTIVQETVEARPDFTYLNNLFRLLCPTYLLMNGPTVFSNEILKKLDIPEEMNLNMFRRHRNKPPGRSNIITSNLDSRHLMAAKTRVTKLNIPGLSENTSDCERSCFISSVLPMEQSLVVISLSNLLEYIEVNFPHLLYKNSVIISTVSTHRPKNQMLIDMSTFLSLKVFNGQDNSREVFNLFNLLNQCSSHTGIIELRELMSQPTCSITELEMRYDTVNWCCQPGNFEIISEIRKNLRKIRSLSLLFTKIVLHGGKPFDVKSFKRSVYNSFLITETCSKLPHNEIATTFLKLLADSVSHSKTIKNVLCSIEWVVDIEAGERENRFFIRSRVDSDLDAKRELMESINGEVHNATKDIIQLQLPGFVRDFYIAFIPGMGFMVAAELLNPNQDISLNMTNGDAIDILYRSDGIVYFTTQYCNDLNIHHGDLHGEIGLHESRIFDRLIKFIMESLPELTPSISCAEN